MGAFAIRTDGGECVVGPYDDIRLAE